MKQSVFPAAALANHIAVLGKTGSGKSSTEKLIVEQVVASGSRVCILDPIKSDWWGLTSSADGKKAGLPFKILGGPHGHVQLQSSTGGIVGSLIGAGKLPLSIIDMADFEPGGLQRFFVDFADALMRNMSGVLYLVVEEAHEFAPKERAGFGGESMTLHWAKKLATAGRSKGIRLIVATQRVQGLHNAVLGSCETVIAHRLGTPADQKPIIDWLRANSDKATADQVAQSLSSLPTGTGWLCSGEARIFEKIAFPKFRTYDNAATPMDDGPAVKVKTAPVDQAELRAILGAAVADSEENDPKKLRAKIAEMEKAKGKPDAAALQEAREAGRAEGLAQGRAETEKAVRDALAGAGDRLRALADTLEPGQVLTGRNEPVRTVVAVERRPARAASPPAPAKAGDGALHPAARKLLIALAQHAPGRFTWGQTATLAGLKPSGGHYNAGRKELRDRGLIVEGGDLVSASAAGIAEAGEVPPAPSSPAERLDLWCSRLPSPAPEMLRTLAVRGERYTSPDELAATLGKKPAGGHWNSGVAVLRNNGLVEMSGKAMRAADLLRG